SASVDSGDVVCIGQAVERQCPRQRNYDAAVDETAAEAAGAFGMLVEMDPRRVLVEPCRNLVLGFLDRDSIHVVDALAHLVVCPKERRAGEDCVVVGSRQLRQSATEFVGPDVFRQIWHMRLWGW